MDSHECSVRSRKFTELVTELGSLSEFERRYVENYNRFEIAVHGLPRFKENAYEHFVHLIELRSNLLEVCLRINVKEAAKAAAYRSLEDILSTDFPSASASSKFGEKPRTSRSTSSYQWMKRILESGVSYRVCYDFRFSREFNNFIISHRLYQTNWILENLEEAVGSLVSTDRGFSGIQCRIMICNETKMMEPLQDSLVEQLSRVFPIGLNVLNFKDVRLNEAGNRFIVKNVPLEVSEQNSGFDYVFVIDPSRDSLLEVFNRSFSNRETGQLLVKANDDFESGFDYGSFDIPSMSILSKSIFSLKSSHPLRLGSCSVRIPDPHRSEISLEETRRLVEQIENRKGVKLDLYSKIVSCGVPLEKLKLIFDRFKKADADNNRNIRDLLQTLTMNSTLDSTKVFESKRVRIELTRIANRLNFVHHITSLIDCVDSYKLHSLFERVDVTKSIEEAFLEELSLVGCKSVFSIEKLSDVESFLEKGKARLLYNLLAQIEVFYVAKSRMHAFKRIMKRSCH